MKCRTCDKKYYKPVKWADPSGRRDAFLAPFCKRKAEIIFRGTSRDHGAPKHVQSRDRVVLLWGKPGGGEKQAEEMKRRPAGVAHAAVGCGFGATPCKPLLCLKF